MFQSARVDMNSVQLEKKKLKMPHDQEHLTDIKLKRENCFLMTNKVTWLGHELHND